jgi:hypothetical protein
VIEWASWRRTDLARTAGPLSTPWLFPASLVNIYGDKRRFLILLRSLNVFDDLA